MKKAVMCIAQNRTKAEFIIGQLQSAGFGSHDVSVLFPETPTKLFASQQTRGPDVAGDSASFGILASVVPITVPGLGAFVATGPLLDVLGGEATGGIAGALTGMGIPETEARRYEGKVQGGKLLVAVHTESRTDGARAQAIFDAARTEDVCFASGSSARAGATRV